MSNRFERELEADAVMGYEGEPMEDYLGYGYVTLTIEDDRPEDPTHKGGFSFFPVWCECYHFDRHLCRLHTGQV